MRVTAPAPRTMPRPSGRGLRVGIIDGHHDLVPLALICLGQAGVETFVLSKTEHPRSRYSRHTRRFTSRPWHMDETTLVDLVGAFVGTHAVDVLLPCVEASLGFCARHEEALRELVRMPPLPDEHTLDLVDDKCRLAEHVVAHGLGTLAAVPLHDPDAAVRRLAAASGPIVVKPRRGSRGRGIRLLRSASDLPAFCAEDPARRAGHFAQPLVGGDQWGASVFCHAGKIIARTTYEGLINQRLSHSLAMRYRHHEAIDAYVNRLMASLEWSGLVNVELRLMPDEQRIELLDFNPRIFRSTLGSLAAGVNFPWCAVQAALGESTETADFREGDFFLSKAIRRRPLVFLRRYLVSSGRRLPRQEWSYTLRDPRATFRRSSS